MELSKLREQISTSFNISEIKDLCFDLGVEYENLSGATRADKTRELVKYCQRHGRLNELVKRCKEIRPNVSWEVSNVNVLQEAAVLVIGSGTAEKVLQIEGSEVNLGLKHQVRLTEELYGGSGVDYSLRLESLEYNTIPILSIGNDWRGKNIQKEISRIAKHKQVIQFVTSQDFLCNKISTQQSTIIVANGMRSTFGEDLIGAEHFKKYLRDRINQIGELDELSIKAIMIGHIYADSSDHDNGQNTKEIIERFGNLNIPIFTNFGRSQYSLGNSFWQETLKKVTVFQLAFDEVREFFKNDNTIQSLRDMIEWFQYNEITAVITLEKMGAIATLKDGKTGVTFARPYNLKGNLVDPTGAGDAFGAGLVSYFIDQIINLENREGFSKRTRILEEVLEIGRFEAALKRGREWASYACTTLGAANNCPDRKRINDFTSSLRKNQGIASIRRGSLNEYDSILWLIDQAF